MKNSIGAAKLLVALVSLAYGCSGDGASSDPSGTGGQSGSATGGSGGTSRGSQGSSGQGGASTSNGGGAGSAGGSGGTHPDDSAGAGGANAGGGANSGGSSAGTSSGSGGASRATSTTSTSDASAGSGGKASSGGATGAGGSTGSTSPVQVDGHYQMERLDRGLVAVQGTGGVYVGWRMFGYEYDADDPSRISYNVYRDGTRVATVKDSTNYLDASGTSSASYTVSAIIDGAEEAPSDAAKAWAQNYVRIPISAPGSIYSANDGSPGDLDGDGEYEIVLKWDPSDSKDNSQSGVTSNVFLDAYKLDGTRLWRIDLGPNIRAGQHYTQLSVYDFDGDGKAEVACKTAPGTKDGTGSYLSKGAAAGADNTKDYRNSDGYILTGPEWFTVFDGKTGKELGTIDYPVPRGTVSDWGDKYGNRVDRFNGGVAFVADKGDGTKTASGRPSIITGRGYYTRLTVSALTYRDGTLKKNWVYDSVTSLSSDGAGDHSEMAADTDSDGAQEIITGAATIASNGTLQCQTGLGHGDALHVGELIVGKPISVFTVHEGVGGYDVHDGATCKTYVKVTGGDDNGRGVADYIEASATKAAEFWSATASDRYSCADGTSLGSKPGSTNFLIYWDADESRELEDGTSITKFGGSTLLSCSACASNNGTKSVPVLTADLFGDWREEIVWRESDNSALRVYTTTAVTTRRIYTLMHDPQYRAQVSFEQSAYNQPPHAGFHIGAGMASPPKPDITVP